MLSRISVAIVVFVSVSLSTPSRADSTLIYNAHIVPMSEAHQDVFKGYILFDDEKILELGQGEVPETLLSKSSTQINADNKIVMPGFVSGHNHLWQSAFRGLAADKELYGWLNALHFTYGKYFSDGDFYAFTLHGALDQLAKGITTSYNHSQRLRATEDQYLESFTASMDSGQHFVFSYNLNLAQKDETIKSDFDNFVSYSKALKGSSNLLDISLHSVGAYFGEEKLKLEMNLAKRYKLTAQIHYLEEYQRRFIDRKKWPMFLRAGAVYDGVSYAHFIHTTDKIIRDSAERGAAMIWNPLSNGRLASGLADIPKYQALGLKVGMGVDGAASADIADPFENMRMGMYALRMRERNANVMLPIDILKLHTIKTAEVIQTDKQVGSLDIDKRADILIIDPAAPGTGATFDPLATLVFACNADNIESVFVSGKLKVNKGNVIDHDTAAIQRDVSERVAAIVQRATQAN